MANPPIVIGQFDNVPAPGSPIRSDWPQEISTAVTATQTSLTAMQTQIDKNKWNSAWGLWTVTSLSTDVGNSGLATETAILSSTAAPYTEGRRVYVTYLCTVRPNVAGDLVAFRIRRGVGTAGSVVAHTYQTFRMNAQDYFPVLIEGADIMTVAAGSPTRWTFTLERVGGSGNIPVLGTMHNVMTVEDYGPVTRI